MIRKDSEKGEYRGVRATLGRTGISHPAGCDQGSAFGIRKLLKKFDPNFIRTKLT